MLEFLLKRGGSQCVRLAEDLITKLEHLGQFAYISIDGRDQGVNVRHRYGIRPGRSGQHLMLHLLVGCLLDQVMLSPMTSWLSLWAWVCCSSCAIHGLRHQGEVQGVQCQSLCLLCWDKCASMSRLGGLSGGSLSGTCVSSLKCTVSLLRLPSPNNCAGGLG